MRTNIVAADMSFHVFQHCFHVVKGFPALKTIDLKFGIALYGDTSEKCVVAFQHANPFLLLPVQVPWVLLAASAIRLPVVQMAVRSCAVGGAMTQLELCRSPSASASSNGAALWSARTARRP